MSLLCDNEQFEVPDPWMPVNSNIPSAINTKLMAKKWRQRVCQLKNTRASVKVRSQERVFKVGRKVGGGVKLPKRKLINVVKMTWPLYSDVWKNVETDSTEQR